MESTLRRKTSRGKGTLAGKILRILGMDRSFVGSSSIHEEENIRANIPLDYTDWRSIETAWLEAERKKAKALIEIRKHQFM